MSVPAGACDVLFARRCRFGQLSRKVSTARVSGEVTQTACSSFASFSSLALRLMACTDPPSLSQDKIVSGLEKQQRGHRQQTVHMSSVSCASSTNRAIKEDTPAFVPSLSALG